MTGLSPARLARMREVMAGYVERGDLPGLVTLVCRRGEVHADAVGLRTLDKADPMRRDTIFRISSMSKPIIAAAAMILVEECVLRLDEPVDRLLPELAERKVLRRIDGPVDDTVAANRAITVRDLLTLRMGIGAFMVPPGTYPIQAAVGELQINGFGPPEPSDPPDADEWMRRFATLPLMCQPGEMWLYHVPFAVLGVLIARASGQSLESFLHERVFVPLGMRDTGFGVPAAKSDRLAGPCLLDARTGTPAPYGQAPEPAVGAELVSTVDDMLAFGQMMLGNGRLGSERILSRPSVQAMTTDQLTPAQKAASQFLPGFWERRGWGFGVSVVTRRDDVAAVPGRFGWDGGLGTSWYVDPSEEMIMVLMTQRAWDAPDWPAVSRDFWTSAYQAIDD